MKQIVLLLCCLAGPLSAAQAGELYRWVDSNGAVHYGDTPPASAVQIETIKSYETGEPGENLSYETLRAQQNFPVTLYVADNCTEYCEQARNLLNNRGIPYNEINLQTQEDVDAFRKFSGSDNVPTLAVGRSFLKGILAEQWHKELDIAGYPKIAPYRAPSETSIPAPAADQSPADSAALEDTSTSGPDTAAEP